MRMWRLIFSNIRQRPARACVSVLAVSLGVVLVLVSVGLSYGQLTDNAERTRRIGGDFMLQPTGASFFFALNSGTLPVKMGEVIEAVDGVQAATPILVKFISDGFHSLFGIDRESFWRVSGGLRFTQGRVFEAPFEAVIDTIFASANQLQVGDTIELLGHSFTIVGIYQEGTAARVMIPLSTLQELNGTPEKATVFFIRAAAGVPLEQVEASLKSRFKNYQITRTSEIQRLLTATAPGFQQFLTAIIFISVAISFLVTLLAMYSTIIERTREIGILKSLGASKTYIVQLILKESILLCLLGVATGFLLTTLALKAISAAFPTLPIDISPYWRFGAALLALLGGTLGALYPALKAAQLDPVQALGYE